MIETPITDWNVVVAILFGATAAIPLSIVAAIKAQMFLSEKLKEYQRNG